MALKSPISQEHINIVTTDFNPLDGNDDKMEFHRNES